MRRLPCVLVLAACGSSPKSSSLPSPAVVDPTPRTPIGPDQLCLAGDCQAGKGALTLGRGADRAVVDGRFTAGTRTGDAIVYRVAGETFETLEIDAASGTGTLHHPSFDVVGQVTAAPAPQLADASAAVMMPTGEWFFAEWSPTTVAAKDSNLTGARSVPKVPEDYGDLFAGVTVLEEARHAGRALELRPPGGDDEPFAPHVAIAPLVAFVPAGRDRVAYIVGVGVVDPESPAMAPLRAGKTPTGPIAILRADGSTAQLEIAHDVVTRWPTWTTTTSGWRAVVAAKRAVIATHRRTATATLATARTALADADLTAVQTTLRTHVTTITDALATAVAEADVALEALPGTEAAQLGELRALRAHLATSHAHATLAAHVLELADPTREVRAIFDDVLGQIAP